MKTATTILLAATIAFAGVLTAPAMLDTVGIDAAGADLAPTADAREGEIGLGCGPHPDKPVGVHCVYDIPV